MRKTLEAASVSAAVTLAAEAQGLLGDGTKALESAMSRFGDDLDRTSLRLTAGLITLAGCLLVAAVLMSRHD